MCGHFFLISSDSYLVSTYEFTDKTLQIAEEQLVMTIDKPKKQSFKDTKVSISLFSADISKKKKFQDGHRSTRLNTAISLQLRCFSKIATIVHQKDSHSFQQWV